MSVSFGGLRALSNVDLDMESGQILGLIGPNGAGKTTLVNVVSGFQEPTLGEVRIDGVPMARMRPHTRAAAGVVRTFQAVRLFEQSTVVENVEVAALCRPGDRRASLERSRAAIDVVGLSDRAHLTAGQLAYGDERLVGIARALAAEPSHLMLDEPAAGMNENETRRLETVIRRIRDDTGCGILLIEHDFSLISAVCDRVQVLEQGRTIAVGTPDAVRADPAVIAAYLGESLVDESAEPSRADATG